MLVAGMWGAAILRHETRHRRYLPYVPYLDIPSLFIPSFYYNTKSACISVSDDQELLLYFTSTEEYIYKEVNESYIAYDTILLFFYRKAP